MSQQNESSGIRVNKFLSEVGYCSRREADKFIDLGIITINGEKVVMGMKVQPGDEVRVSGKLVGSKAKPVYLALNKPQGITCTTDQHIDGNIVDFVNFPERIFPIGRLDKPSEGLILLTNDGDIVNKILRAGNNHEKEYVVTVDKAIDSRFIAGMSNGVPILDTVTNKCKVEQTGPRSFNIILTQGLNRQIRRMCEHFGFRVRKLKRMRIMNISVDNIATGQWRHLTKSEMRELNMLIADSKKTAECSDAKPKQAQATTTPYNDKRKSFSKSRSGDKRPRSDSFKKRTPKKEKYAYTPKKKD
ncbi:23S rRNA pseudouridine(2604) synthase RluF [Psychrobium sp. 1_MG-2023]|uniref:23S rRNA pseudouridine(2604) synthase RluF n=1 Tax=Psychrobium sp. 1_MG-2023 TaxID=3062624 RepID=UPI000C34D77F|nr:23S rRNA pseudouridine(2604) synthase RluF [Psychrobium sp. 1_MG-2023]MDP2561034.1 23S rRNA pseudouridine(2604) synthase RluF [Psychrobium sp. 1_MG-2023]PKF58327.1 23S rRNA pseudouridine(2604) synthase RluF [Alteromonadales bacterium alter-6D02]